MLFLLFGVGSVWAQPAMDIKTQPHQEEQQVNQSQETQQTVQVVSPTQSQSKTRSQPTAVVNQNQETPVIVLDSQNTQPENLQNLKNRIEVLENENKIMTIDEKTKLETWWQIGFWTGILWFLLWIFVGWQWAHFKFWNFGWPWPWWFWIPVFWFIPWLIIAWQWWNVWWVWWVWIWWIFPWVFWIFWWIILFKESTIWVWRRRKPSVTPTE